MAILALFWRFLCDKMAKLGPIDFKFGLHIKIKENDGQNRFEVHISKIVAKMANFCSQINPDATFAATLNGHNSAIFDPILTFDHTKITSSSRGIEWW